MRGPMNPFALRAIFYFSLAVSAFWFAGSPAWAQFYVRSPEVEKGVAEGEEHGAVYAGPGEEERLRQSHEAEFKNGLGLAFRTIYEFALQDHSPDEILFGPLAKYVSGRDSVTVNTFFVGQVGNDVEIDSLELQVNWRLKHELNERWAMGVEGYSEIEDLSHVGSFDEQAHRLGPVAYYEFPHVEGRPEWKAAGGVLFGVSDAVSDLTYKFDLEVEF